MRAHLTRNGLKNETGSTLVMALVMLSVVGLLVGAGLAYGGTSMRATNNAIRPNRAALYDADSAIQAALQYVKANQAAGGTLGRDTGRPCPPSPGADPAATFTYPGTTGNVAVTICPKLDSFNFTGDFRSVLLTLAPTGQGLDQTKNTTVTVAGNVWSNSYINVRGMDVTAGRAWAWNDAAGGGSCASNSVTASAGKDCAAHTTFGFTTLSGALTAAQTTMTVASAAKFPASEQYVVVVDNERMLVTAGQGTSTWTVTRGYMGTTAAAHSNAKEVSFLPKQGMDPGDPVLGHADEWKPAGAPGPVRTPSGCTLQPGVYVSGTQLTNAWSGCPTLTLAPGVFYLAFPSTDATWTINGTLQGPTCASAADVGAQLVLADNAQISNGETINIPCGARATPTAPRIAVYGLTSGTAAGAATSTTLRPAAVPTQAGDNLYNAATLANVGPTAGAGYPQDNTYATATVSQNNRTALLNIGSITPPVGQSIPANAAITSVVVKVGHSATSNTQFPANLTRLVWGGCTVNLTPTNPTPGAATLYTSPNLAASLDSCATFDPSQPATVTWNVRTTNGAAATIQVDGAQIDVTWNDPGIAPQQGCVFHGTCDAIHSASENGHDTFIVKDVVYMPASRLQTTCKNNCTFDIGQALIAWSVDLDANPAAVGDPFIGGTLNTFLAGKVLFQASINGTPWIDSYAMFNETTFAPSIASWVIKK